MFEISFLAAQIAETNSSGLVGLTVYSDVVPSKVSVPGLPLVFKFEKIEQRNRDNYFQFFCFASPFENFTAMRSLVCRRPRE